LVSIALGAGLVLTTLDPIKLTEYAIASLYLIVLLAASVATIPLMIVSKAGGG
jgi:hypothetical protein